VPRPVELRNHPRALLIAFLGALVIDRSTDPVGARVLLDVLTGLGVTEPAARSTLSRMTREGALQRLRTGRVAAYRATPALEATIRDGRVRVEGDDPFGGARDEWTLVSFSVPETHRAQRHRLRARLHWAGFAVLRDGLWLAPGHADTGRLLADLTEEVGVCEAFLGRPLPGTDVGAFIARSWDLPLLGAEHDRFTGQWGRPDAGADQRPMLALTAMSVDWLRLLGVDPGLPPAHLPPDWPAGRSAAVYRRCWERLFGPAAAELREVLAADAGRR
jgi:phenylacetic acid degradation operon negative regulatory protein